MKTAIKKSKNGWKAGEELYLEARTSDQRVCTTCLSSTFHIYKRKRPRSRVLGHFIECTKCHRGCFMHPR